MASQDAEFVTFDQVAVGDVLTFLTKDNNFGRGSEWLSRTGTVTAKTDKTVTVDVGGGHLAFKVNTRGHGYEARIGATARIHRRNWSDREPRRVSAADGDH